MSGINADLEKMRRMAASLDLSAKSLREQKTMMVVGFAKLHEKWRDEKYAQFESVFTESMKMLDRYIQQSEQYGQFLKQKAARAQKYLDQR